MEPSEITSSPAIDEPATEELDTKPSVNSASGCETEQAAREKMKIRVKKVLKQEGTLKRKENIF